MSSGFRLPSSLFPHRELLAVRPSPLPSTCSHHKRDVIAYAIGQPPNWPLVHKKLHFSTKFPSIPRNPHTSRTRAARSQRVTLSLSKGGRSRDRGMNAKKPRKFPCTVSCTRIDLR